MSNKNYLVKLALATIAAYLASYVLTRTVIFSDSPKVRPEFQTAVTTLPQRLIQAPQRLLAYLGTQITLPLSWLPGSTNLPSTGAGVVPSPYQGRIVYVPPSPPILYPGDGSGGAGGGTGGGPEFPPSDGQPPQPLPTSPPASAPTESPPQPPQPTTPLPPTEPPPPAPPPSEQAATFLGLLNAERGRNGAGLLQFNAALNKAAQDYANILNTCDHLQGGSTPFQRARAAGYPTTNVGENITCMGHWTAESAFNAWMSSPPHRSNMLNANWKSLGLGMGGYGWVLLLGPI